MWFLHVQVTRDGPPTLWVHFFGGVGVDLKAVRDVVGAVKPVNVSAWEDVVEDTPVTVAGFMHLDVSTALWVEEQTKQGLELIWIHWNIKKIKHWMRKSDES